MKLAFALLTFALSLNVFAVECRIETLKDAQKCMNKVASTYPDYEEPNEGVASTRTDVLKKVLKALGHSELAAKAGKADFVGFMLEHGDEHHLYYFTMKKGKAAPVELYEMNLVDLAVLLDAPVTMDELFLKTGFKGADVKEDIEEAIAEFGAQ